MLPTGNVSSFVAGSNSPMCNCLGIVSELQFPTQYLKQNVSCPIPCQAVKFFCCLEFKFEGIAKDTKIEQLLQMW